MNYSKWKRESRAMRVSGDERDVIMEARKRNAATAGERACSTCNGRGTVTFVAEGFFSTTVQKGMICPYCSGRGYK